MKWVRRFNHHVEILLKLRIVCLCPQVSSIKQLDTVLSVITLLCALVRNIFPNKINNRRPFKNYITNHVNGFKIKGLCYRSRIIKIFVSNNFNMTIKFKQI